MFKALVRFITLGLSVFLLLPAGDAFCVANMAHGASVELQDAKAKEAHYAKFKAEMLGDASARKAAYETAKQYLQKYPDEKDPRTKELKDWMALYEADMRGVDVLLNVYKEKKYAEAFALGKQVLVTDPDNIKVLTALGYAGIFTAGSGNASFNADAATYAKKAIQLIEGGGIPVDWKPFASKDETLGWLNYSLGLLSTSSAPADSIGFFVKAARLEGAPKKDPTLYYYLAFLYEKDYQKQTGEYKTQFEGKPDSVEGKAAMTKIGETIGMIIDSYARVIAYIDADPIQQQKYQAQKAGWMNKLTTYYKFHHNDSEAGLKELIAEIRMKPMPGQVELVPVTIP